MSEENVALLRGLYASWAKGVLDPGAESYAPDALFEPIADGREAFDVAGFRRFMQGFLEQWDDFRVEVQDVRDFGDRVLVTEHQTATGKRSRIPMEQTNYAVWTFGEGLVTGIRWEMNLEDARRLAGEPD